MNIDFKSSFGNCKQQYTKLQGSGPIYENKTSRAKIHFQMTIGLCAPYNLPFSDIDESVM